jgi:hypothetical protein
MQGLKHLSSHHGRSLAKCPGLTVAKIPFALCPSVRVSLVAKGLSAAAAAGGVVAFH